MQDPKFLAEAEQAKLELNPISGREIEHLLNDIIETMPPKVIPKAKGFLAAR